MNIYLTELALRIENDLQLNDTKKSKELAEYFIKLLPEYKSEEDNVLEDEISDLEGTISDLEDEISALNYQIEDQKEEIKKLEDKIFQLKQQLENID